MGEENEVARVERLGVSRAFCCLYCSSAVRYVMVVILVFFFFSSRMFKGVMCVRSIFIEKSFRLKKTVGNNIPLI